MKIIILIFFIIATITTQAALNGKWVKVTTDKQSVAIGSLQKVSAITRFQNSENTGTSVIYIFQAENGTQNRGEIIQSNNGIADWNVDLTDLPSDWYELDVTIDGYRIKKIPEPLKVAVVDILDIEIDIDFLTWLNADGKTLLPSVDKVIDAFRRDFRVRQTPKGAPMPEGFQNVYLYSKPLNADPFEQVGVGQHEDGEKIPHSSRFAFIELGNYELRAECGTTTRTATISITNDNTIHLLTYANEEFFGGGLQENTLEGGNEMEIIAMTGKDIVVAFESYRIAYYGIDGQQIWTEWRFLLAPFKANKIKDVVSTSNLSNDPFEWARGEDVKIQYRDSVEFTSEDQHAYTLRRQYEPNLTSPVHIETEFPQSRQEDWTNFNVVQEGQAVPQLSGTIPALIDWLGDTWFSDAGNVQILEDLNLKAEFNIKVPSNDYPAPATPNFGGTKWFGVWWGVQTNYNYYSFMKWDAGGYSADGEFGFLYAFGTIDYVPVIRFSGGNGSDTPEAAQGVLPDPL